MRFGKARIASHGEALIDAASWLLFWSKSAFRGDIAYAKSIATCAVLLGTSLRADSSQIINEPRLLADSDPVGVLLQNAIIWATPNDGQSGIGTAFRKRFKLDSKPESASLNIFADSRYLLWVNGVYIGRGPARFQDDGPEFDTIDLQPQLRVGVNAVAILVVGNLSSGKVMMHAPGVTARLNVNGNEMWRTDNSWRWNQKTRFRKVEATWSNLSDTVIDARVEDGDWTQTDYDDGKWANASFVDGNAWGRLSGCRIPLLRESTVPFIIGDGIRLPVRLLEGQKLSFSTGNLVQVYPKFTIDATDGAEMEIAPFGVHYFARKGLQSHFTIDTRGMTNGEIVIRRGSVIISDFQLIERLYPFDRVGSFRSNDEFLNRLWSMCVRSCQVLSEDAYVDCADRERVEWIDNDPPGFEVTQVALAGPSKFGNPSYGDPRLLAELIRRTALTRQPGGWVKAHTCSDRFDIHAQMEDRSCEWVAGIRRLVEATNDCRLVREIWPSVESQMDYFLARRTSRGLVRGREWTVWGNPLGYITGETTTLNDFVQRALVDASVLAKLIGEDAANKRYASASCDLSKAINSILWNEERGEYFSGYFDAADSVAVNKSILGPTTVPLPVNENRTPSTLYSNLFTLDRGVVPVERRDRVNARLFGQLEGFKSDNIMIYYYLCRHLYRVDNDACDKEVLSLFRKKWADMVGSPWQCSWESFDGTERAHIYGSFPAYFLSAYVLGVRRELPISEKTIIIEPHLGDLQEAGGTVVTEFGPVEVQWKWEAKRCNYKIVTPLGVKAVLKIPYSVKDRPTICDGKAINNTSGALRTEIVISEGAHAGSF